MKTDKRQNQDISHHALKSELKKYSSVAGALIGMTAIAQGQVVYTDIDPDVIISNDSLEIDFDHDSTIDLTIAHGHSASSTFNIDYVYASGHHGGQVRGYNKLLQGYNYTFVSAIDHNQAIKPTDHWYGSGALGLAGFYQGGPFNYGQWLGKTNKYVGARFLISGEFHYGWVRLDVPTNCGQATIKDYAYESIAGLQIRAGDFGNNVGINGTKELTSAQAYSFGKSLYISLNNPEPAFTIEVYNSLGARMYSAGLSGSRHEIRLNEFPAGIYVAEIKSEDKIFRKKFHLN